jgi:hypothetical protein
MFNRGDTVQIIKDAAFIDGRLVPSIYLGEKLVVKSIEPNGYVLGRELKMPSIGIAVNKDHIMAYEEIFTAEIDPYYISMVKDTDIYASPAIDARVIKTVPMMSLFRIVNEKDGWGKLEVGSGWVKLSDVMII